MNILTIRALNALRISNFSPLHYEYHNDNGCMCTLKICAKDKNLEIPTSYNKNLVQKCIKDKILFLFLQMHLRNLFILLFTY